MSGGGMFGGQAANDGVFRQQQVYGESADNPTIDSAGNPLVQSLEVAFQAPGHMRVARVLRDPKRPAGQQIVEYQEQFRPPSPEEVELLKEQGVVKVGPGGVILSGLAEPGPVAQGAGGGIAPGVLAPAPGVPGNGLTPVVGMGQPSTVGKIVKYGAILGGIGLVGYVGYKFAWPWLSDKLFDGGGGGGSDEGED